MCRSSCWSISRRALPVLLWFAVGCQSAPSRALPTATPLPLQVILTATATFLPPPTVTPYPPPNGQDGQAVAEQPVTPLDATDTLGAASNPVPIPQSTPIPPPSATLSPIPAPTLTPTVSFVNLPAGVSLGGEIYASDFSAGWPAFNDPTAKIAIVDSQYRFEIGPFDGRFLTTTALNQSDLYVQVEATPETCPDKAGYGLMFHFKDANNYYLVTVFCDSSFTAVAKVGGSLIGLSDGKLPNGLEAAKNDAHHVGVLAHGSNYDLYLDGQSMGSFTDGQFPKGDIAIYAVSQGGKVLKVTFDNLKVWSVS